MSIVFHTKVVIKSGTFSSLDRDLVHSLMTLLLGAISLVNFVQMFRLDMPKFTGAAPESSFCREIEAGYEVWVRSAICIQI